LWPPMTPAELPQTWRDRAAQLRRWAGAEGAAIAWEAAAAELDATMREAADAPLTLAEGARESNYSERRLRELVAEGAIPNAGRKGAPRIRRGDLPRRPGKAASTDYDAHADAARLLRAS
jgi:hypothetical protein